MDSEKLMSLVAELNSVLDEELRKCHVLVRENVLDCAVPLVPASSLLQSDMVATGWSMPAISSIRLRTAEKSCSASRSSSSELT